MIFAGTALVLTHFYFIERSPFIYTLFPSAVLTAAALEAARGVWLPLVLSGFSAATALYIYLGVSIPLFSNAGRAFAATLRENTRAEDAVLTNLRALQPPFANWDSGGIHGSEILADRLVFSAVTTGDALDAAAAELKRSYTAAVFALVEGSEIAPDFRQRIEMEGRLIAVVDLVAQPEPETLGQRVRKKIWELSGRYQGHAGEAVIARPTRIVFYRLK